MSDYGIRSLSKYHEKHPFVFQHHGHHQIQYESGESRSDMFGGNSNWRGPVWMPTNYLLIESLREYHKYYGFIALKNGSLKLRRAASKVKLSADLYFGVYLSLACFKRMDTVHEV